MLRDIARRVGFEGVTIAGWYLAVLVATDGYPAGLLSLVSDVCLPWLGMWHVC